MQGNTKLEGSIVGIPNITLPKKFSEDDIVSSLPKLGYVPFTKPSSDANAKSSIPLYYTTGRTVVFPPCTDNPNKSKNLEGKGVSYMYKQAIETNAELLANHDLLIFPLLEEWNVVFKPRFQWVLLVYVKANNEFRLFDPTSSQRAYPYRGNLKNLETDLQSTFFELSGNIRLLPCYLNLQSYFDTESAGHWILYLIHQLTTGVDISGLLNLEKQVSTLTVQAITKILEAKFSETNESNTEDSHDESDHENEKSQLNISKILEDFTPTIAKQDFVSPSRPDQRQLLHSLLSVRPDHGSRLDNREDSIFATPPSSHFALKLYSYLIFAGVATTILAMFCLASTTPILSATVSTGILATGILMFVGGILGKCGLFGRSQSSVGGPDVDFNPTPS